jgi:hypothetical protein
MNPGNIPSLLLNIFCYTISFFLIPEKAMTSSSNIFAPVNAKFDLVCKSIESDPNYRIIENKYDFADLIAANRHKEHETLVLSVVTEMETDERKVYNVFKTTYHVHDNGQTPHCAFETLVTPRKKIIVSKKDGSVQIVDGLYGAPGCGHLGTPLTDCKLEDFLNQPCIQFSNPPLPRKSRLG